MWPLTSILPEDFQPLPRSQEEVGTSSNKQIRKEFLPSYPGVNAQGGAPLEGSRPFELIKTIAALSLGN